MLCLAAGQAQAQWSADPSENLAVSNAASDQNLAKFGIGRGASAGSSYISWFDGIGTGWDVRLQRIGDDGTVQWPAGGVLVADRSFSSTEAYGLDVDADGNAWLAFRMDNTHVGVQKVAPDGTPLLNGGVPVIVSDGAGGIHSPNVVADANGNAVVAWSEDTGNNVIVVKISGVDGSNIWTHTEVAGGTLRNSLSDLELADAGSVIVSYIHGGTSFTSARHLWANKISAAGAPVWAAPAIVYDLTSMPFGNFPTFVHDGAGGGVFGWYGTNNDAFVQQILADGSERFVHNGVVASTHPSDLQVSVTVLFDAPSDQMYLFWLQRDAATQSTFGVYGQKFDGESASRQWGDEGRAIVPLDGTERSFITPVLTPGGGAVVAWFEGGFGAKTIRAARVDADGNTVWGPLDVSTSASDKGRLTAAITPGDMILTAWTDQRFDGGDIYAQNLNLDGTLGGAPASCLCETDGNQAQVDVFDLLAYLDGWFANDAAADIDGTAGVDVFDLLAYLDCWFPASAGSPCP
jgi:hypothetical protein